MARAGLIAALLLSFGLVALGARAETHAIGAGTAGRHWLRGTPTVENPKTRYPVEIVDDVAVVTRDGIHLDGRLFQPTLAAGAAPTPCVLMTDGYGRESKRGSAGEGPLVDIASRGYAVLHLSLRGTGNSGGKPGLYAQFGEDGYDAVEWMARQPWCNGRVGMVGYSLLGISQWLTAMQAPPHLQVIVPQVACADCYDELWYPGGMLPGPGRIARGVWPATHDEVGMAMLHRNFDAFWRQHTTTSADVEAIAKRGVAAFIAGGQDDYISPANLRAYTEFGPPDARKRLLFGPYAHGWHLEYIQELQIHWLDRWLKDAHTDAHATPRVIIYVKGADRWRGEADWPIPDAHSTRLFLSPEHSGSGDSLNDGSLTVRPPVAGAPATLPYSPTTGPFLPVLLSAPDGRSTADQRPSETKVLTWTTPPLSVPTEVTGYPRVTLWGTTTAVDADLVFSLNDVAPDGTSKQVIQGYVNAPRAHDPDGRPTPLVPGRLAWYSAELFPVAYVVQAGHRLRLAIAGGADAAPGTVSPQGPGKNPLPNTWTFPADAVHAASLELPIIGSAWRRLQ
jgi:predicted acyl esterase